MTLAQVRRLVERTRAGEEREAVLCEAYREALARTEAQIAALEVRPARLRALVTSVSDGRAAARKDEACATGYVLVEQVCALGQPEVARRALARETVERYLDTAQALCECDPEAQFEFGLESLIAGMAARISHLPRLARG